MYTRLNVRNGRVEITSRNPTNELIERITNVYLGPWQESIWIYGARVCFKF